MNVNVDLSDIKSFEEIYNALDEVIRLHNFVSDFPPSITIRESAIDEMPLPGEQICLFPSLHVSFLSDSQFNVYIGLADCYFTPFGDTVYDCLRQSRFAEYFQYSRYGAPEIDIECDLSYLARFLSYYMRILGYGCPSDFVIKKFYSIKISDKVFIAPSLRSALDMFVKAAAITPVYVELDILSSLKPNKTILVTLVYIDGKINVLTDFIIDAATLTKMREYHNFDCISYNGIMEGIELKADSNDIDRVIRFLIDYFLFYDPDVKQESVYARLDFSPIAIYEDDAHQDWSCTFLPDGSIADPEQFRKCLDVVRRYDSASK